MEYQGDGVARSDANVYGDQWMIDLEDFEESFASFDSNGNGYISTQELELIESDLSLPTAITGLASRLKENIGSIEELSNDEYGDENSGVSLNDLHEFGMRHDPDREQKQMLVSNMSQTLKRLFPSVDIDDSGTLDGLEIQRALSGVVAGSQEHSALGWLRDNQYQVSPLEEVDRSFRTHYADREITVNHTELESKVTWEDIGSISEVLQSDGELLWDAWSRFSVDGESQGSETRFGFTVRKPDAPATVSERWEEFYRQFNRIDRDKDGFLSSEELQETVNDETDFQSIRNLAARLHVSYDEVISGSDDEIFFDNNGVSRKDLVVFAAENDPDYELRMAELQATVRNLVDMFSSIDENSDGYLDHIERVDALSTSDSGSPEHQAAMYLVRNAPQIAPFSRPITYELEDYVQNLERQKEGTLLTEEAILSHYRAVSAHGKFGYLQTLHLLDDVQVPIFSKVDAER